MAPRLLVNVAHRDPPSVGAFAVCAVSGCVDMSMTVGGAESAGPRLAAEEVLSATAVFNAACRVCSNLSASSCCVCVPICVSAVRRASYLSSSSC